MRRYLKKHWDETRGDNYDAWGTSCWYFEVDLDGRVIRQIEQYESGPTLRYSAEHENDDFGGLATEPLNLLEVTYTEISHQDFEHAWQLGDRSA